MNRSDQNNHRLKRADDDNGGSDPPHLDRKQIFSKRRKKRKSAAAAADHSLFAKPSHSFSSSSYSFSSFFSHTSNNSSSKCTVFKFLVFNSILLLSLIRHDVNCTLLASNDSSSSLTYYSIRSTNDNVDNDDDNEIGTASFDPIYSIDNIGGGGGGGGGKKRREPIVSGDDENILLSAQQQSDSVVESNEIYANSIQKAPFVVASDDKFDCSSKYPTMIRYDFKLFYELKMLETLVDLYKSCFKHRLSELKDLDLTKINVDPKTFSEEKYCKLRFIIDKLLFDLVNNQRDIIPETFFEFLSTICPDFHRPTHKQRKADSQQQRERDLITKLYRLSTFKSPLCSYIFKNSIRRSHLYKEILLLKDHDDDDDNDDVDRFESTPSNNNNNRRLKSYKQTKEKDSPHDLKLDLMDQFDEDSAEIIRHRRSLSNKSSSTRKFSDLIANTNNNKTNLNNNRNQEFSIQNAGRNNNNNRTKQHDNSKHAKSNEIKHQQPNRIVYHELNNCSLIILNIYLISIKTQCGFNEFVDNLNHYDCVSNNFSVKSDCDLCQKAYKKWLCSSSVPFYENNRLIKPCQRYCFEVQNLCPFFRPVEDIYGGQPVFHCRNVIQVYREISDGFVDNDENFMNDDDTDEERCYGECLNNPEVREALVDSDIDKLLIEKLETLPNGFSHLANYLSTKLKINSNNNNMQSSQLFDGSSSVEMNSREDYIASVMRDQVAKISSNAIHLNLEKLKLSGRFTNVKECLFNIDSASTPIGRSFSSFTFITTLLCSWIIIFVQRIF